MKKTKRVIAILLSFLMVCFSTATAFANVNYDENASDTSSVTDINAGTDVNNTQGNDADSTANGDNANTDTENNADNQGSENEENAAGSDATDKNNAAGNDNDGNTAAGENDANGTDGENSGNADNAGNNTDAEGDGTINDANADGNHADTDNNAKDENNAENENGKADENNAANTNDCNCGSKDGTHSESCPQYVAPAACKECGQTEGHLKSCSLYEVQAGDTVWILKGSRVYKTAQISDDNKTLDKSYEVTVAEVTKDASENIWYKFNYKLGNFLDWFIQLFSGYEYVQAVNTSITDPTEKPEAPTEGDFNGITSDGIGIAVNTDDGAFPEGTTAEINDVNLTDEEKSAISAAVEEELSGESIDYEILGTVGADISFYSDGQEVQPSSSVEVSMEIPADKVPEDANRVIVVHIGDDGNAEVVHSDYRNTGSTDETITFEASSFSSYVSVFVDGKYNAKKLSEVLESNGRYSIKTVKANLFDYDPGEMNKVLNDVTSDKKGFNFRGYTGLTDGVESAGINDTSATTVKQGIVQNDLSENGVPIFNFLNGENAGKDTGKLLFDADTSTNGKTTYKDVDFEMVYEEETGSYIYKSSANHAQYNSSSKKIELYADTLSILDFLNTDVDLSTYSSPQNLVNYSYDNEKKILSATSVFCDRSDSGSYNRHDPYMHFNLTEYKDSDGNAYSVNASEISKIYVKFKVPESVGSNKLQVYFKSNNTINDEAHSFKVKYTATGDWIEAVIYTNENSNWSGTISQIRIDPFDTGYNNELTKENLNFEIAQISLMDEQNDAYTTKGGFYPFSDITSSYPGHGGQFALPEWTKTLFNDGVSTTDSSRAIIYNGDRSTAYGAYYSLFKEKVNKDLAFGASFEIPFYIPADNKAANGKDLEFYFNGDDDMWVFVDGKLVLDLGGGHGAVTGTINFTEGTWAIDTATATVNKVNGYNSVEWEYDEGGNIKTDKDGYNIGKAQASSGNVDNSLWSTGQHTLQIFYMERGASVSNCFMKFNLPTVPTGSVTVSKTVDIDNATAKNGVGIDETLANEDFTFQITAKNNTAAGEESSALANKDYILYDGKSTETKQTGSDGKFTLKHGQYAVFDIEENHNITVEELLTEKQKQEVSEYKYVDSALTGNDITIDTDNKLKATGLTLKDGELRYDFTNTYHYLYGSLKITKTGISSLDHDGTPQTAANNGASVTKNGGDESQSTIYEVWTATYDKEKNQYSKNTYLMDVAIHGNDSVTINHLREGHYLVIEKTNWAWRYEPDNSEIGAEVYGGDDPEQAKTDFNNKRTDIYWLSGDCYCENHWPIAETQKEDTTGDASQEATPSTQSVPVIKQNDVLAVKDGNDEIEV